jgi:hypothetical protein
MESIAKNFGVTEKTRRDSYHLLPIQMVPVANAEKEHNISALDRVKPLLPQSDCHVRQVLIFIRMVGDPRHTD